MRIAVLGSTRGTNLDPLAAAIRDQELSAELVLVLSNIPDAPILEKAQRWGIPYYGLDHRKFSREAFEEQLSSLLEAHAIELIVLIGYMRILSSSFVAAWKHRVINIHPSLLPKFAGLTDRAVHQAVLDAKEKRSGCTVHYVVEAVDEGPIILQQSCPVFENDSVDSLKARVQAMEGKVYVEAIKNLTKEVAR